MGVRFWRRFKIAPGVTVNLSKTGASLSFGVPGAKFTIGPHGKRATVGLPGTGLFYTKKLDAKDRPARKARQVEHHASTTAAGHRRPELLSAAHTRTSLPEERRTSFEACLNAIGNGQEHTALEGLRVLTDIADAAFIAGVLVLRLGADPQEAVDLLVHAASMSEDLGDALDEVQAHFSLSLPITDEVWVYLQPDRKGTILALVEALQRQGRIEDGIRWLRSLQEEYPADELIRVSLEDLLETTRD